MNAPQIISLPLSALRRDLGLFSDLGPMDEYRPAERAARRRAFLNASVTPVPRPPRRRLPWSEEGETGAVTPRPQPQQTPAERAWEAMQTQRRDGAALIQELFIADLARPLLGEISATQAQELYDDVLKEVLGEQPELSLHQEDLEQAVQAAYLEKFGMTGNAASPPANLTLGQKTRQ